MEINANSGQVEIIDSFGRVYLYTHSHGKTLVSDVYEALNTRKRWDDADYLAKIVFCHMLPVECWKDDKGFGIGTQLYVDVDMLISLDTQDQTITITSSSDKGFYYKSTFSSFLSSYASSADFT
jgi:hypothetical protein